MCGSLLKLFAAGAVSTELKKTSLLALMPPSAAPVFLLKLRIRPLSATMNWLGPAAPMESGGKEFSVSASVAPRKFRVRSCGDLGTGEEPELESGKVATSGEPGFAGRFWKSGLSTGWVLTGF